MRDPNRLDKFYNTMKALHQACFPDWRFSQLMLNFLGDIASQGKDTWYWEEDKFIEEFRNYCKKNSPYFDTTNYEN